MTDPIPAEILEVAESMHFDASSIWVEGEYEANLLLQVLTEQSDLAPAPDEVGNLQGRVRLDYNPDGGSGFWVTFPTEVDNAVIQTAIAAYPDKVTEHETAQAEEAQAQIVNAPITRNSLTEILNSLPDGNITKTALLDALAQ